MQRTIGSISHATMKPEDLIPVFMNELETLDKESYNDLLSVFPELKEKHYLTLLDDQGITDCLEELFDRLNDCCMSYFYFGSNEGDGADYGFWLDSDTLEYGDLLKISDLSDIEKQSLFPVNYDGVLLTNDHGNITLYDNQMNEIWSIV